MRLNQEIIIIFKRKKQLLFLILASFHAITFISQKSYILGKDTTEPIWKPEEEPEQEPKSDPVVEPEGKPEREIEVEVQHATSIVYDFVHEEE